MPAPAKRLLRAAVFISILFLPACVVFTCGV
jgi:hypothetical protein